MVIVLVSDGDRMVMVLVGDGVSFISKGRATGGFSGVCLSSAPVWVVRFFRLKFSFIINLFNFFSSSMACTHVSVFKCVGFEPGALRVRV